MSFVRAGAFCTGISPGTTSDHDSDRDSKPQPQTDISGDDSDSGAQAGAKGDAECDLCSFHLIAPTTWVVN
jgi:hypothetical protein